MRDYYAEEVENKKKKPKKENGLSWMDILAPVRQGKAVAEVITGRKGIKQAAKDELKVLDRLSDLVGEGVYKGITLNLGPRFVPPSKRRRAALAKGLDKPRSGAERAVLGGTEFAAETLPIITGLGLALFATRPILPAAEKTAVKALPKLLKPEVGQRLARGAVKAPGGAAVGYGVSKARDEGNEDAYKSAAFWSAIEFFAPHLGPALYAIGSKTPGVKNVIEKVASRSDKLGQWARAAGMGEVAAEDASIKTLQMADDVGRMRNDIVTDMVGSKPAKGAADAIKGKVDQYLSDLFDNQRDAIDQALLNEQKRIYQEMRSAAKAAKKGDGAAAQALKTMPKTQKQVAQMAAKNVSDAATAIKNPVLQRTLDVAEQAGIPRAKLEALYNRVASHIDETAQAAVDANIMSQTTYDLYKGAALRRTYKEAEQTFGERLLDQIEGVADDGAGLLGSIPAKAAARRTMMRHLMSTPEQRAEWGLEPFLTRLQKRESLSVGMQSWAKQAQGLANQAITPQEYTEMLIKDPKAARVYGKTPVPNTAMWGPLRKTHLPKIIQAQITETQRGLRGFARWIDKATSIWKAEKTVLSSGTHAHNGIGDFIFTFLNDPLSLGHLPRATKEYIAGLMRKAALQPNPAGAYEQAAHALALSGNFTQTEFLRSAAMKFTAGDVGALRRLMEWPRRANRAAMTTYASWDTITKLNAFMREVDRGVPWEQAADQAQLVGLDYNRFGPFVNRLARGWFPFIKFPLAVMTQTSKLAARNPSRAYLLYQAPDMYSRWKSKQDGVDIELSRKVMPDFWNKGTMIYIGKDELGRELYVNAATSTVWGQHAEILAPMFNQYARTKTGAVLKAMEGVTQPIQKYGNPIATSAGETLAGRRFDIEAPISNSALPEASQLYERGRYFAEAMLPPAVQIQRQARTTTGPTAEHPSRRTGEQEWLRLGGITLYGLDVGGEALKRNKELLLEEKRLMAVIVGVDQRLAGKSKGERQRAKTAAENQLKIVQKERQDLQKYYDEGKVPSPIMLPKEKQIAAEYLAEPAPPP